MLHSGCSALHAVNPLPLKKKERKKQNKTKQRVKNKTQKKKAFPN